MSVRQEIRDAVQKIPLGELFFPADFRMVGSDDAIKMALSRMVRDGEIKRIAHGIYYVPQYSNLVGNVLPSLDRIAEAIAKHDHVRIKPAGSYALNKLGLSTQVPMKQVYITNGPPRSIKVGKGEIRFKSTNNRKLALQGNISSLVILALDELGPKSVSEPMRNQIREVLLKEDPEVLAADAKLAPAWIHDFLYSLMKKEKQTQHEMAELNG
ncbi:MAG: DUF6088 family protein [Sediminibacterium sp.]|nr:DUF6088 family protein [Sediminibacterium sp.]